MSTDPTNTSYHHEYLQLHQTDLTCCLNASRHCAASAKSGSAFRNTYYFQFYFANAVTTVSSPSSIDASMKHEVGLDHHRKILTAGYDSTI